MRLYWCLIGSVLVHLVAIQYWDWHLDARSQKAGGKLLTVRLMQSPDHVPEYSVQAGLPVDEKQSEYSVEEKTNQEIHHEVGADEQVPSQAPRESEESAFGGYLSTSELDRKAQPISNINLDMMQGITSSGLNIKLRLYINEYGHVVRVDELMVLEQDREFKSKLVELLYDLTFLPAKKNGVSVSSYQDVSLNFNPILNQPLEPASN